MLPRIMSFLLILGFIATPQTYAAELEMAVGGWQQSLSGTISYQALSALDVLDIENDLQMDDENRLLGRVRIGTPAFLPNIYLIGAPAEFEGTGSKSVSVKYGDTTFNSNAQLTSKATINQYDIGLYWGLPFVKTASAGKFNIDVGLNARIVDLEASITGLSGASTVTENKSITAPIPMIYLAAQIMPTDSLTIEAEGRGISIGDNKLYSLTGRLRYQFAGPVFIAGGYRYDKLEIDEEDVVADIELAGPFVEIGMKF